MGIVVPRWVLRYRKADGDIVCVPYRYRVDAEYHQKRLNPELTPRIHPFLFDLLVFEPVSGTHIRVASGFTAKQANKLSKRWLRKDTFSALVIWPCGIELPSGWRVEEVGDEPWRFDLDESDESEDAEESDEQGDAEMGGAA